MEELYNKEPPTSTRTSNPQCDRLDFDNDDGGINAADQSLELSDAQDSDEDLEEGEIQSEADTNEDDMKFVSEVKGKTESDLSKKPHIPNFNIVKCKQSNENDSPASSILLDSSTDQFKTESSDLTPDSYNKIDMESSDGEIYSASEDNQVSDDRDQSVDLYDMVFDFKSEKDQSTADSLDDTLTEDISEDMGKKRKHAAIGNECKGQNDEGYPVAKKSKQEQLSANDTSSDAGNLIENGSTHEFDVIDETNEEGGDNFDQDAGEYDSDEDDLDDNEIYAWLEEGVNKKSVKLDDGEEGPSQREKLVLQEKGSDPFDMLPEGWVLVTHNSGMPVYLHKQSRVVTFSKPYFIGPGSVRKHNIPVSAIPCLYYRREKEREAKEKAEKEASGPGSTKSNGENNENGSTVVNESSQQTSDPAQPTLASLPVKIEYAEEREKENSLEPEELRKYCESLFEFRKITVNKFKTWKDRRRHLNNVKKQSRPALPSNTKLITCKVPTDKGDHKPRKKEFVLNPTGKSYVCILHEYAQHTLRVQPRYVFKELENAQNPYSATIIINEIEYGTGFAGSKRAAKMEAAKATLSILIPEMSKLIEKQVEEEEDLSFFDDIKIEDPRVYELCNKSGQPSPFQILLECLKRNYGLGDTQCKIDVKTLKHQKSEYTLSVGKHSVTVVCKNKREGKQSAAQAMLKQLHPHIYSLGALLRLYGRSSWKSVKEKKKEEHAITGLQSQVRSKRPNEPLLSKLKEEMMKIQMQRESVKTKGKFRVDTKALSGPVTCIDL